MSTPATSQEMQELSDVFDAIRFLFEKIVDARDLLFRQALRADFENAWRDVRLEIEAAQSVLQSGDRAVATRLGDAGLSGAQLRLKLNGFRIAWDRFQQRGTLKLMGAVLDWINKLLGSILSAIPGVEGVKEFKDAIEGELSDDDPV